MGQATADDVTHVVGDADLGVGLPGHPPAGLPDNGTGLGQVAEHLPNEERVAGRLAVDDAGQRPGVVVEFVTSPGFHERLHARLVEATQSDAGDPGPAEQVDGGVGRLGGEVGLRVPVGDHHQQA